MRFRDRADAGAQLAVVLEQYHDAGTVVAGLARGGVVVAAEVARALGAPLHVTVVRKLGHPDHPELGLGALAEDGVPVWNRPLLGHFAIGEDQRYRTLSAERGEIERCRRRYGSWLLPESLSETTVLLVDDGLATGGTARAAVGYVRRKHAARVVVAVPVGGPDTVAALGKEADHVVALVTPAELTAVGQWYEEFEQCSDEQVIALLTEDHDLHSL